MKKLLKIISVLVFSLASHSQAQTPICFNDNFATTLGTNWVISSAGFTPQIVTVGTERRFRINNNTQNNLTFSRVNQSFAAANRAVTVKFDYFTYGGNGGNGMSVVFSDASVAPSAGAWNGFLGYPFAPGNSGFSGGWLGIALDQLGNNTTGNRGYPGGWVPPTNANAPFSASPNNISIRSSAPNSSGYRLLANTGTLATPIWNNTRTSTFRQSFEIVVNNISGTQAIVEIKRGINGGALQTVVGPFDLFGASSGQLPIPTNFFISFMGETGTLTNFQELSNVEICTQATLTSSENPTAFECIEPTELSTWSATARKPVYTKLANTNFNLDIVPLKSDGTIEEQFVTATVPTKTATVELFDRIDGQSCSAYSSPLHTQTVTFTNGTFNFVNGRTTSNPININRASRNMVCRVTHTTPASQTVQSCSSDGFSIRPQNIALNISANNFNPPNATFDLSTTDPTGTNPNTANFTGAGQPFNLSINTNTPNYSNSFNLDSNQIDWPNVPAGAIPYSTQRGVGQLVLNSTAPALLTTGNNANMNLSYSEVGYFRFLQGAIHDRTWTAVDSSAGDCNLNASNTLSNNRYGCYLENSQTNHIGRFAPTQFTQSPSLPNQFRTQRQIANSCPAPSNIYFGEPILLENSLEARNSSNQITRNYHGNFAKVSGINLHAKSASAIYDNRINLVSPTSITVNQGVLSYSSNFNIQRAPNFSISLPPDNPTDLTIGSTINELDNIRINAGLYTATNISPLTGALHGNYNARFGRINISNVKGSDITPHRIPVRIEYYQNGSWITNSDDNCTRLYEANFSSSNFNGNIQSTEVSFSYPSVGLNIQNGLGYIILNKPSGGDGQYSGSFRVNYNLNSSNTSFNQIYLGTKISASNLYNENPYSFISLGRVNRNRIIFLRENF